MPEYKPKNQFEQYVVDAFEIQTTEIKRIGNRLDAQESDIVAIDNEVECIQQERAVEKGKRKILMTIGGAVWSIIVILFSWLLSKMGK